MIFRTGRLITIHGKGITTLLELYATHVFNYLVLTIICCLASYEELPPPLAVIDNSLMSKCLQPVLRVVHLCQLPLFII